MQYDPIKKSLGKIFNKSAFLRKQFYHLLDLLLLRAWHIQKEIKRWKKSVGDNLTILDAGAGFGQYTYFLSRQNATWNITAVDVKKEQVDDCNLFFKQIQKDNKIQFSEADLTSYVKKDGYDLIITVDVMEHIEEDEKVFSNFFQSLKHGGMLLISTPSDQGGSDVHDHGHEASFIDEHVRDGYNIQDIEDKLIKTGFRKVECRYSYGLPGKISWQLSMKYPIIMLGWSNVFFVVLPLYYFITFPFSYLLNILDVNSLHKTGTGLIVKAWK
jgi:SAM-dependent methyltransferase